MTFFDYVKNIFILLLFLVFAPSIFESIRTQYGIFTTQKTIIGIIKIQGDLVHSAHISKQLHRFFSDDTIKAIVLSIESCGGAAGTGQAVAHEILTLKKQYPKPIVALTENMCASGGYYIASATDYIICSGQALVGSIGSYIPHMFQLHDFLQKHTVGYALIKAGQYKASTDPFAPLSDEAKIHLQSVVDNSYEQFIEDIARNRKLIVQDAPIWADGKIFTGKQAKELHLIDELGSVSQAKAYIKDKLLIAGDIEWIYAEPEGNFLQRLCTNAGMEDRCKLFNAADFGITNVIEKIYLSQSHICLKT